MSRREVYFEILSLMDNALVRGANHFTTENEVALKEERGRWMEMGGSNDEKAIIDRFLSVTSAARGEEDDRVRYPNDQILDLKRAWRNAGAPE
ncbi:hypothetical protein [Neomegalonema perideroedes]|uniref:hypothetical protein n=1 Tax=Neomegalonema perideroedes TaxID=217219 RepID=UPI0012FDA76B|nr:hypothetical protein [Neomegalonema perideroedes]